jgi:hypothetical protein
MSGATEVVIAIFSMLAGGFWMSAAYATTEMVWPWQTARPLPESARARHQIIWNGRAAVCASIAAILQALLFLFTKWPLMLQ